MDGIRGEGQYLQCLFDDQHRPFVLYLLACFQRVVSGTLCSSVPILSFQ